MTNDASLKRNSKVMNRLDLTTRLVAKLRNDEAVIGGIGNSNFWAISQHAAPSHLVGRAIGYLNTIAQLAGAAAPLITGWILGPEKQFGIALAIAGVSAPLAAGCLIFTGARGLERMRATLESSKVAA